MARNIFIVNATQVVTSAEHPEGLHSVVSGYPKKFDSRSYPASDGNPNGDSDAALMAAKSEYHSRLSAFETVNANRVMATVTLETAQGRMMLNECIGNMPDMPPAPAPVQTEPEE